MNTKFIIFLIKIGVLKVNTRNVEKWISDNNVELLNFSFNHGDFRVRKRIIQLIHKFPKKVSLPLLKRAIHDDVFIVVDEAIQTLHSMGTDKETEVEIQSIIKIWEEKEKEIRENWNRKVKIKTPDLLFDRSQMVRLKQLKDLMNKQKGSMALG